MNNPFDGRKLTEDENGMARLATADATLQADLMGFGTPNIWDDQMLRDQPADKYVRVQAGAATDDVYAINVLAETVTGVKAHGWLEKQVHQGHETLLNPPHQVTLSRNSNGHVRVQPGWI